MGRPLKLYYRFSTDFLTPKEQLDFAKHTKVMVYWYLGQSNVQVDTVLCVAKLQSVFAMSSDPRLLVNPMSHVSCLTSSHDCLWDNRWFCILFVGSKIRGNPELSALCLALLGMAGNSGLYKLVSSSCSPYTLSTLGKECQQIFPVPFGPFCVGLDCTKWLCTIIYCARMCTFKRSDGFSNCFHYFLGTFWASNFDCEWYQMASVPSLRTRLDCPLCRVASKVFGLWEASTGAPLRRWTTELPVDRVW